MAGDALAPCVPGTSAVMVLIMHDKQVLVFHEDGFYLSVSSECHEMIDNANIFLCFKKIIQHSSDWWQMQREYRKYNCIHLYIKHMTTTHLKYSQSHFKVISIDDTDSLIQKRHN